MDEKLKKQLENLDADKLRNLLNVATPIASITETTAWTELKALLENEIKLHTPHIDRFTDGQSQEIASLAVYCSALNWVITTVENQKKIVEYAHRELNNGA